MAGPETLLHLAHLGALQVAQLEADLLDGRADGGARPQVLGVAITSDDLRRRYGCEPEGAGYVALDRRVDVGVRADGAGQLGHGDGIARRPEASAVAVGLEAPQRHLHAEGGGLGVHAVGAADGDRVAVLDGDTLQDGDEIGRRRDEEIGGVARAPSTAPCRPRPTR